MANLAMELVWPATQFLAGYADALRRGWSPDNFRPERAAEDLARIAADPQGFLTQQVDKEAHGPAIRLPDGETVPRLPGYALWMWDGEFCGSIGFRWQRGTTELPPYCLGHVGYAVVPWKRGRGYATRALGLLLPYARAEGLTHIDLTTTPDNIASQRVIEANGGFFVERFQPPPAYGRDEGLRFRIVLTDRLG